MSFIESKLRSFYSMRVLGFKIHRIMRVSYMFLVQKMLGIRPRRVVFESFEGFSYNDNPRYISEKLHEMCPEAEIIWIFRPEAADNVNPPAYVRRVRPLSLEGLAMQATARFWVDNFRHVSNVYLNTDKQYYINTWHGDRGFKRVGDDNEKLVHGPLIRMEKQCAMMIAGSEFGANNYRTAFHMTGDILMDGCPRNDILMRNDPDEAVAIRKKLNIPAETGILLYAPTYRDDCKKKKVSQDATLDVTRTLDCLERHTGRRWVCFYRAHYQSAGINIESEPRLKDVSRWPEMAELLLISDMLITDYSSCGCDFTLLRRPMFLYQPDVEEYLEQSRSFYFDMEDSPFLIAHNQDELEALIIDTDAEKARKNGEDLDRFFGTTETGHASEAVCRYIMERMQDKHDREKE